MSIVDFGAGTGHYALPMAQALQGAGHVYAIDVQKELLRKLKNDASHKGLTAIDILWADLEQPHATKLNNRSVDMVLMSNVLFQIEHKAEVFKEAARILRDVGRLFVIDWTDSFNNMGPHKDHVLKKDKAIAIAQEAGFMLKSEFAAGAHHYGLLFTFT